MYEYKYNISYPSAARFSEKQWVRNGVHSASCVQLGSYLKEKVAAPEKKIEITVIGICCADHVTPLCPQKLALTLPTDGGRSVDIVSLRTKATDFSFLSQVQTSSSKIPDKGTDFSFLPSHVQTSSGVLQTSCSMGTGTRFMKGEADHFCLVLRLRLHETVSPKSLFSLWHSA
jgi:hypothetical protein